MHASHSALPCFAPVNSAFRMGWWCRYHCRRSGRPTEQQTMCFMAANAV